MYVTLTHFYHIVILSHSPGTETGIHHLSIRNQGTTYLCLIWGVPKYSPICYTLSYQCSLMCENKPYTEMSQVLNTSLAGVNLTMLKPGSVCKINLVVLYNPAQHDPGVDFVFETLHSGKAYTYM